MNIGVVISRYNEDLSWALPITHKLYIYNKGPANIPFNSITLQNVGRESHTYLHHVVSNYDCLDDYTVFLQGNPKDHGFYDQFGTVEKFNDVFFTEGFHPFLRKSENYQYFTCPGHECNLVNFAKQHNIHLEEKPLYEFVQGAQFAVKRENILKRPKEIYEGLLYTLTNAGINPPEGHTMERMWKHLFNP